MIARLLANPHTTWAAVAYIFAKLGSKLGGIWMPEHKAQFDETANAIEAAAVGWGFFMAGDSKATEPALPPVTPTVTPQPK